MKHHTFEDGLKYRPDYQWPEPGTEKKCPKCGEVIPEGKEACEYMQCSLTELELKNEMGEE